MNFDCRRANFVSPNFSQFFFFFFCRVVWFGSNYDSVHSSGASVQTGPTQNSKLVRFIACVGYARVDITMLTSLDDMAVATDWTPRIDMVELRGDTWH